MSDFVPTTEQVRQAYEVAHEEVGASYEPDEFYRWLAEVERAAAEKAIKALEIELVGSMDDGTFTAPWVEIPAGEIREKIWAVFDSYGAAALGLTAEQEGEKA